MNFLLFLVNFEWIPQKAILFILLAFQKSAPILDSFECNNIMVYEHCEFVATTLTNGNG